MEEHRLLDERDHRVPDPAEHRVVRPHHERVLAALGELPRVAAAPQGEVEVAAWRDERRERRVDAVAAALDVFDADHRVGRRMAAVGVEPEDRMEDLDGRVGVERRDHLCDAIEPPIQEARDPRGVLDGSSSRAAGDEQLELRQAEGVLHVDQQQCDARLVLRSRPQPLRFGPCARLVGALLVRHAVDARRPLGVEERRQREGHRRAQTTSGWITRPDGSLGWKNVLFAGIDSDASATSTICWTGVARIRTASRHARLASASSASFSECT